MHHIDLIFHMHILGVQINIFARCRVSMIKLSLGELYTDTNNDNNDANDTRWTNHDCVSSLPNEPKTLISGQTTMLRLL